MKDILMLYWCYILLVFSCFFLVFGIFACFLFPKIIIAYLLNLVFVFPLSIAGIYHFATKIQS